MTAAQRPSPKIADSLNQVAAAVQEAQARRVTDLTSLSNSLVHVRADGAVEVVLHADPPVGADQIADLTRLGAQVGPTLTSPTVLVPAWVPAARLSAVAALPWVAAITPPAYLPTGG